MVLFVLFTCIPSCRLFASSSLCLRDQFELDTTELDAKFCGPLPWGGHNPMERSSVLMGWGWEHTCRGLGGVSGDGRPCPGD